MITNFYDRSAWNVTCHIGHSIVADEIFPWKNKWETFLQMFLLTYLKLFRILDLFWIILDSFQNYISNLRKYYNNSNSNPQVSVFIRLAYQWDPYSVLRWSGDWMFHKIVISISDSDAALQVHLLLWDRSTTIQPLTSKHAPRPQDWLVLRPGRQTPFLHSFLVI